MTVKMNIDLSALQAAGVDFKLNKNDIIDLFVEELKESLERRQQELEEERKQLEEAFRLASTQRIAAQFASLSKSRTVKSVKLHLEKLAGTEMILGTWSGEIIVLRPVSNWDGKTVTSYGAPKFFYAEKVVQAVVGVMEYEAEEEKRALDANHEERREVEQQLYQLHRNSKKIRTDIVRAMLSSHSEGQKLLALLDSRKSRARLTSGK